MENYMSNKQAFTLIELLVVVLIVGILAAVALPQYEKSVQKARFAQLVTLSRAIVTSQNEYYMENGVYASRADELTLQYPLNDTGTRFQAKHFTCGFEYANGLGGYPRTSCLLYKPKVTLQRYHKQNSIVCCSYAEDDYKGDFLCQDATNKTTPYSNSNSMRCYSGDI